MQLNNLGNGYGTPQQVTRDLNAVQANLDPNSTEYKNIEQRKSDLVQLSSQGNPLSFLANSPPPQTVGPEPTPQERVSALSDLQATLAPNSSAYQEIEKVKASILATAGTQDNGYGTPLQIFGDLSAVQANLDPNSAEYKNIEARKQALLGNSPNNSGNSNSVFGLLVGMMKMLFQLMFSMNGSKS